jgi:CBS domain-containing protein
VSAVSEIMSKGVVTVESTVMAADAVSAMVRNRIGAVIVLQQGKPAGIITERDVLKKVSACNAIPGQVPAKDIMSSPLITVRAIDSVDTAAAAMAKNRVKRLPVIEEDGSIAGIMSVTDIAIKLAKILADDNSRYKSLRSMLDL